MVHWGIGCPQSRPRDSAVADHSTKADADVSGNSLHGRRPLLAASRPFGTGSTAAVEGDVTVSVGSFTSLLIVTSYRLQPLRFFVRDVQTVSRVGALYDTYGYTVSCDLPFGVIYATCERKLALFADGSEHLCFTILGEL